MREDFAPQLYQPRVNGNWGRDQNRQVRQPQRDITKKFKVSAVRPEKFQFLEKCQNRNFGYKIVISVKNSEFIL